MHVWLRRFRLESRGNVAVVAAFVMIVVIGFTAFAVDVAKLYVDRRKAQSTVDLAAIAAASNLSAAERAAGDTVVLNLGTEVASPVVEFGTYTPDASRQPADRFRTAPAAAANAVRVTLRTQRPTFFARALTGQTSVSIQTSATAVNTGLAAFAIGSRLADVDSGLLNQLLGGLLGTNVSLSAADYRALLATQVDAFDMADAVASRAGLTGSTYQDVLAKRLTGADILGGAASLSAAGAPLAGIGGTSSFPLGAMLDLGPYAQLPVGQHPPGGGSVSLFDLLAGIAHLSGAQHPVALALDLQVPGVTSASLMVAVGEPAAQSSWFAIGSRGASVHTAQTRLLLKLQVQGLQGLTTLNVPVYAEVARGTATLDSLACGYPDVTTSRVTLGVSPGIVDAWIGDVTSSDFTNFTWPVTPGSTKLLHAPLLDVMGLAHVTSDNAAPTSVAFSYADTRAATRKTVTTTDYSSSLFTSLLGGLRLSATAAGVGVTLPAPTTQAVTASLKAVAAPLDQKLATIFGGLGVGLGQADVWVSGLRCDGAVLVN